MQHISDEDIAASVKNRKTTDEPLASDTGSDSEGNGGLHYITVFVTGHKRKCFAVDCASSTGVKCTLNFPSFSQCINVHNIRDSKIRYMSISLLMQVAYNTGTEAVPQCPRYIKVPMYYYKQQI
jgi:hypothetical protein